MRLPRLLRYPLLRLLFRERFKLLNELLQNQQLSRKTLHQQQHQKLVALLKYAVQRVPFYHQQLGTMDWSNFPDSLPILHKSDFIHQQDQLLDRQANRSTLKKGYTGGSTGTPLSYYYNKHKIELMRAAHYRSFMQCGWRPGDPILQFWGASQDLSSRPTLAEHIKNTISGELTVDANHFDEQTLQQWCKTLNQHQPILIRGYPSILAALAHHMVENKIQPSQKIKGCFSTAEVLYPQQRSIIGQAFHCKVYNQYGSREIPNISCECPHGKQHIYSDLVWLESLKIDHAEQLVATSLTNYLQPLIRYTLGDSGSLEEGNCSCGSPFPIMKMEVCRSNDLIHIADGSQLHPSKLIHLLDEIEGIEQFQFTQHQLEVITLQVVTLSTLPPSTEALLKTRFAEQITPAIQLNIESVQLIDRGASGKYRFVRSNLS